PGGSDCWVTGDPGCDLHAGSGFGTGFNCRFSAERYELAAESV
ncbi:MAG: hypothetical protein K0R60_1205, partial [Microbacterium sp.]|nr:hypothetical protein [Microbacterium sp.]